MRKAGEKPCGCQHEEPEVFQTIWKHLKSDGMPDQAANQLTAEMLTHGEDIDSSIEAYERNYANFRERGYNEHAAQAMAVESLEGGEEPQESIRFARIYGWQELYLKTIIKYTQKELYVPTKNDRRFRESIS